MAVCALQAGGGLRKERQQLPPVPLVPDHGFARIPVRGHVLDLAREFNPPGARHDAFLPPLVECQDTTPDPIASVSSFLAPLPCVSVQSLYTVGAALHI